MTVEEICNDMSGHNKEDVMSILYSLHQSKIINFDGKILTHLNPTNTRGVIEGV